MPKKIIRRKKRFTKKPTKLVHRDIVKTIKRIDAGNVEIKSVQQEYVNTAGSTPTLNIMINWPAQGVQANADDEDGENTQGQRIGNSIVIKDIYFCINIFRGNVGDTNAFRLIVFQWMEDERFNSATAGDILMSPSDGFSFLSPLNYITKHKYRILKDWKVTLVAGATSEDIIRTFHFRPGFKKIQFAKNTDSGVSSEIIKGNIYYMVMSDGPIETVNYSTSMLCKYTDA